MSRDNMPMNPTYHNQSMKHKDQMPMHTTFFWGKDVELLFAGWPGTASHLGIYILALVVVFLLAVGAEILSEAPQRLQPAAGALIHASVYGVRMGLLYFTMLSVMSYNIGVFVVAVAGHAVGSFIVKYRALAAAEAASPALSSSPKV
ncbi:hypothetical protein C2S51_034331 [Perilla frutescens var. frutescens]|nr:hypothetical protein C2S51_034331 [Perilla frutescens var. frutescens]